MPEGPQEARAGGRGRGGTRELRLPAGGEGRALRGRRSGGGRGQTLQLVGARLPQAATERGQGQSHGRRDWETVGPACLEAECECG